MSGIDYDLIIIGGGLAGAALGHAMVERGARVMIIEREQQFKDRVRGELMHPWGVAEARALGIHELLRKAGALEVRWWTRRFGATVVESRDLISTTPEGIGCLTFYHPVMQSVVLGAAEALGADVRRGTMVAGVTPGYPPAVRIRTERHDEQLSARLVVGADGRNSAVRALSGFAVNYDPHRLVIAGVLHRRMSAPEDSVQYISNPSIGQGAVVIPIGDGRFRSYFICRTDQVSRPMSGRHRVDHFVAACVKTGAASTWYADTEVAGPLTSFNGADIWVEHPYRDGIVLIGDAAATSDPSWGCGLSLTLRDVRVLRDRLIGTTDWHAAADAYADEHRHYYAALHRMEDWLTILMYETGPDADARRERVFPRLREEPSRSPDILAQGPDAPSDEAARRRFFAEDHA